jgi:hypothetical protein
LKCVPKLLTESKSSGTIKKRNLRYAIYTIYKYAHDENMKYNINQMYI